MLAQSSHIKMFGHLLLNQLPIFHICHDPHTLLQPLFFFFFNQMIFFFLPIFGACAGFCIVLPFFPGYCLFISGWLSFWIEPDQFTVRQRYSLSLCVLKREGKDMRLCICMCVCMRFMIAITGTYVPFPDLLLKLLQWRPWLQNACLDAPGSRNHKSFNNASFRLYFFLLIMVLCKSTGYFHFFFFFYIVVIN